MNTFYTRRQAKITSGERHRAIGNGFAALQAAALSALYICAHRDGALHMVTCRSIPLPTPSHRWPWRGGRVRWSVWHLP